MNYEKSPIAIAIFLIFVTFVLGLSFFLGRKKQSAKGYYAAHGEIPWFINGVAFAGDYLSAASFLGICGMIAFYGYDGFLYSIGYLAGWIVALFVIAEPIKRLGKFTFADAVDSKFQSRAVKLSAAISTLVVSVFYLIPQMVGAGVLVKPLLGLEHHWGVIIVGVTVILIVATAGMVSTTWVQFIKGSLLVCFCFALTIMILNRGLNVAPTTEPQTVTVTKTGEKLINGKPAAQNPIKPVGTVAALPDGKTSTGPLGPFEFFSRFQEATIATVKTEKKTDETGTHTTYSAVEKKGADLLLPGGSTTFKGVRSDKLTDKLDFISLMLALFCGTASLPHILIRYYTVKDQAAARKSTVVGIAAIGFFYVLTLYLGLGAMTSGAMDPTDNNSAAPMLARSFNEIFFAIISAIAFTTVLGTVSGLIMAASGAVAHDIMENYLKMKWDDHAKVRAGKAAAVIVGLIAIVLGILFKNLNVNFLVGWAFNIAASANLPALVMLLFWSKTNKYGVAAAILTGMTTSLAWVLLSGPAFSNLYGLKAEDALVPLTQPGIVTIPLGFIVLVAVSLLTREKTKNTEYLA